MIAPKDKNALLNTMDELAKEYRKHSQNAAVVKERMIKIDRLILKIRHKRKGLEDALDKVKQIMKENKIDYQLAKNAYWRPE